MKGVYKSYSRLVSLKTNSLNFFIISILLISCGANKEYYYLSFYPDNLASNEIKKEGFTSLEECRMAANNLISQNKFGNGRYECSKNCEKIYQPLSQDFDIICKDSSRFSF